MVIYAKVNDENIIKYPYTVNDLKIDNPNVTFSTNLDYSTMNRFGMYEVLEVTKPENYAKNISESIPEFINGTLTQVWNIEDATQTEIDKRIEDQWYLVRLDRNKELAASDWTQITDSPLTEEQKNAWRQYRQELRDITNQADPFSITYPSLPSA